MPVQVYDVKLTDAEIELARREAARVDEYADSRGLLNQAPSGMNFMGICGEIAAGRALGVKRLGIEYKKGKADLERGIEVRTRDKSWYELPFRIGKDDPKRPYVFVTAEQSPIMMVRGWAWGKEIVELGHTVDHAKKANKQVDVRFLPHENLRDIRDLYVLLYP